MSLQHVPTTLGVAAPRKLVADYASGTSSESTRSRFDAFAVASHWIALALT
jgi:hypothetical protein